MRSTRDKIEDIIEEFVSGVYDDAVGQREAADAIMVSLPDMIAPLVWQGGTRNKHYDCVEYAETKAGTYFICDDNDDFTGFYCTFVYLANCTWFGTGKANSRGIASRHHDVDLTLLKSAANTDHRATIMAAFQTPPAPTLD
jgi:hypothetical protein